MTIMLHKITRGKPVASHFIITLVLDCTSIISSSCGSILGVTEILYDFIHVGLFDRC